MSSADIYHFCNKYCNEDPLVFPWRLFNYCDKMTRI